MTILPSFNKSKGAKDHATSTSYATDQKTISKEPRFGLSSLGDLQGSSPIDPMWELVHKYTQLRIHASMEAQVNWGRKLIFNMCIGCKLFCKAIHDYMQIHLHVFYKLVTLFTKGFFEISFTEKVGAIATKKLSIVEWNGMTFSFCDGELILTLQFKARSDAIT
jgi:hypothetical protein